MVSDITAIVNVNLIKILSFALKEKIVKEVSIVLVQWFSIMTTIEFLILIKIETFNYRYN